MKREQDEPTDSDDNRPLNHHLIRITKYGRSVRGTLITASEVVLQGARWLRGAQSIELEEGSEIDDLGIEAILYCINHGEFEGTLTDGDMAWKLVNVDRFRADIES